MLSILIPVYNWSIAKLVKYLHQQCLKEKIIFEIIILDDQSKEQWKIANRKLNRLSFVSYQELSKNVGRASIRNLLGKKAKYPYLLFLDADAAKGRTTFIRDYLRNIHPEIVVYGGCFYKENPPKDKTKLLHYNYGKNREIPTLEQRMETPYNAFKTFNFLIPKNLFLSILFDESIREYGHEDTLFGSELKKRGILIHHIDNPLEHAGLEQFDTFLAKQKKALETLYQLYIAKKSPASKLLAAYQKIKNWKLDGIAYWLLDYSQPYLIKQLRKKPSKLLFLDLFKLHYWLQLTKNKK